jgi:hypothetical protein
MIAQRRGFKRKDRSIWIPENKNSSTTIPNCVMLVVKYGIPSGPSKVKIPDGVKQVQAGDFDVYD